MAKNYLITGYWGEPHVTAENDRSIHAATFGTGRFVLPVGEQFKVEYIGNNTIRMYDGKLMDNGAAAGIPAGENIDLLISNAGQGMKRNDLIVFQYSKDTSTLIERGIFAVIQGTETSGTPSDPELLQNDLLSDKATLDQMALWRVTVSGTDIAEPECLFTMYNNNFAQAGKGVIKYEATTLGNFNTLINTIVSAMDAPATNRCIISKSVWDDGDNLPSGDYSVEIYKSWDGHASVIATAMCTGSQIVLRRTLYEGAWSAWEWENPRMTPNVEYCTTEKWNGKPVYTQIITTAWAKGTVKEIENFGGSTPFKYVGNAETLTLPYFQAGSLTAEYSAYVTLHKSGSTLKIEMCGGASLAGTMNLQIWYTKG